MKPSPLYGKFQNKAANEAVQVPDVGPVTRKRGRPRKPQIVEKITNFVRRSTRKSS